MENEEVEEKEPINEPKEVEEKEPIIEPKNVPEKQPIPEPTLEPEPIPSKVKRNVKPHIDSNNYTEIVGAFKCTKEQKEIIEKILKNRGVEGGGMRGLVFELINYAKNGSMFSKKPKL